MHSRTGHFRFRHDYSEMLERRLSQHRCSREVVDRLVQYPALVWRCVGLEEMAKHPAERLTAHVKSADGVEDAPVSFGLHRDPIEGLKANMNHARQVVRQLTHRIGQVRADVSGLSFYGPDRIAVPESAGSEIHRVEKSVEHMAGTEYGGPSAVCQTAFNIDPRSACKIDPPERHGGGCPGSQ